MRVKRQLLVGLALALCTATATAGEVTVAVAANFTDATRQLVPKFEAATGHTVKMSFGSTGKLFSQIENGAPFQVFLAADSRRPKKAEAEGLGVPGSRFTYARGQVVLWSPTPGRVTGSDTLKGRFERIALANPKTAPYGLAAQQVMESIGVWASAKRRAVQGENIAQAFQFVMTGNAPLGFVALSQVRALPTERQGSSWLPPAGLYDPIEQQAILLKKGEGNAAAEAFLKFLKSDEARAVIAAFGYGVE